MNTIPVPFVSQIVPGALMHNNDCGAASVLMVLRAYNICKEVTVDQIYDKMHPSGDGPLYGSVLQSFLASHGIKNTWAGGVHIHDMYDVLVSKKPIIVLIHYAPLVAAGLTEKKGFLGAHFVVVTGMDVNSICINDPYTTGVGGTEIPVSIFDQAWSQCYLDGNQSYGGIFMNLSIQDLSVPISTVTKYTFGMNGTVPVNAIYVRSGNGEGYPVVKTLWRIENPIVYITTVAFGRGLLADGSGWVWMGYLKQI